ncbi:unnamed protein product [Adineta steineri]|uniref:G domain-containing protein n=1 Tax=Adineta steineri TaxID=433720 RepID=A0A814BZW2_9BILA|nr:unnamed protein product [Adineta steineri]CAF0975065.1 unnamed protein product [Adineta steineri]
MQATFQKVLNNVTDSVKSLKAKNADDSDLVMLNADTSGIAKVLIIGETGSGKSTFINYLTNYFRHGNLDQLRISIPSKHHPLVTENFTHEETNVSDSTQSQTNSCHQYLFTDSRQNNKRYLFLDTPGLGDVRGAQQDAANMHAIIKAIQDLGGLSVVMIVMNGANARLTTNVRTVITYLWGNLPDAIMESVIVVLTNAKRHAANTDLKVLQLRGNVYPFYMQNSAFSKDPKTWDHEQRESLQKDWDDSMYEVKRLLETVDKFTIQSVTAFNNMIDIRNQIKAMLHDARLRISEIQKMQDEIAAYEEAVKKYGDDQVKFKDFTKTVQNKPQLVDAPYHSTLCESCNFVCHDHCGLNETVTKGDQIFIGCWAMGGMNKCRQCPQKCSYTEHYHAKKTMKMASGTTVEIIQDIKAQYDSATSNINNAKTKIKTGADAKKVLEQALKHLTDSIIKKCRDLKSICGNFNLAAELINFIDKLEKEALTLHSIDAKQQADSFIRGLKALCEQIKDERDRNAPPAIQMNLIDSYTTRATSAISVSKPLNDATASVLTPKYCVGGSADDKSKNNPAAASLMQVQQPMLRQYFPFGSSTLSATSGISDDSDLSTLESTHEDNLATPEITTKNEAIFIANLPSTTTKTQLFKVFSQAGRIKRNQARQQVVPSPSSWPVADGNESPPPPSYSQINRGGDQLHKISGSSASQRKVQHCYGRPLMINPLTLLPTSGQQDDAYERFDDDD